MGVLKTHYASMVNEARSYCQRGTPNWSTRHALFYDLAGEVLRRRLSVCCLLHGFEVADALGNADEGVAHVLLIFEAEGAFVADLA